MPRCRRRYTSRRIRRSVDASSVVRAADPYDFIEGAEAVKRANAVTRWSQVQILPAAPIPNLRTFRQLARLKGFVHLALAVRLLSHLSASSSSSAKVARVSRELHVLADMHYLHPMDGLIEHHSLACVLCGNIIINHVQPICHRRHARKNDGSSSEARTTTYWKMFQIGCF